MAVYLPVDEKLSDYHFDRTWEASQTPYKYKFVISAESRKDKKAKVKKKFFSVPSGLHDVEKS
ncbi:hypothetical protein PUN28_016372 [Cardiocondyla obscurior]|uniref:Uncharacterized protein n=1 Tax=Cardiocondyla obscurior TaxID=286306 RepID=A0AAW2ELS5_9HYME